MCPPTITVDRRPTGDWRRDVWPGREWMSLQPFPPNTKRDVCGFSWFPTFSRSLPTAARVQMWRSFVCQSCKCWVGYLELGCIDNFTFAPYSHHNMSRLHCILVYWDNCPAEKWYSYMFFSAKRQFCMFIHTNNAIKALWLLSVSSTLLRMLWKYIVSPQECE